MSLASRESREGFLSSRSDLLGGSGHVLCLFAGFGFGLGLSGVLEKP